MSTYSENLQNPKWQKMRLKILERDEFSCQKCGDDNETLHVHHKHYLADKKPWEYPQELLITLCKVCHQEETENILKSCQLLLYAIKEKFLSSEINDLACYIHGTELQLPPDVCMAIICYVLKNEKIKKQITDKYFKSISKSKNALDE